MGRYHRPKIIRQPFGTLHPDLSRQNPSNILRVADATAYNMDLSICIAFKREYQSLVGKLMLHASVSGLISKISSKKDQGCRHLLLTTGVPKWWKLWHDTMEKTLTLLCAAARKNLYCDVAMYVCHFPCLAPFLECYARKGSVSMSTALLQCKLLRYQSNKYCITSLCWSCLHLIKLLNSLGVSLAHTSVSKILLPVSHVHQYLAWI